MRAKTINVPSFDDLYATAPYVIRDYIDRCSDTPQGTYWHPEGNVGIHIRLVYDRAAAHGDINLAMAAFFHDLGKVDTTAPNKKGGYSAIGHEHVSAKLVKRYAEWINELGGDAEEVYGLVVGHMRIKQYDVMRETKKKIMRENPLFDKLQKFSEFDDMQTLTDEELNRYQ